jgi:hypothetical protein
VTHDNVTKPHHSSNSFVLRIWWEEGDAQPAWRGWVQHATTGEARYFECLADLLAFVEGHTGSLAYAPVLEPDIPDRGGDGE